MVALLRHQTELAHSTQCLQQQTTDTLHNITKSSALEENLQFTHDITIFKAKGPQLFNEWLDQIDRDAALTNNNPYKLSLAKFQGSFSTTFSSYPPTLGWNKIKECLCYNFDSVATKQHATSMLIDQQQKSSETLQEYVQRFLDLLLKSSRLLPHQAKDLVDITHFIRNLHYQKLHYILGKKPTSVQNTIMLAQKKDGELKTIEGLHNHDLGMKCTTFTQVVMTNTINLDPAMHIMVLTSLKIVVKQCALHVNLILIAMPIQIPQEAPLQLIP